MVEGIIYRYRCGIAWRDLPEVFGPWQTVWTWHRRLAADGTWEKILAQLQAQTDAEGLIDWTVSVDSTAARAHQHATNITRHTGASSNYTKPWVEPPDHAVGRSRGGLTSKVHQLVDGHGLPLATVVSPGQANDAPALIPLVEQIRVPRIGPGRARTRPDELLGDKAYSSKAIRTYLRERGITATIAEPEDQKRHRRNRGARGGRPPTFNAERYKGRNIVERGFCHLKQWRGIATHYDKPATTFRAAALLHGVIAWTKHLSDTL